MEVTTSDSAPSRTRWKLWIALGVVAALVGGAVFLFPVLMSPVKTFPMGKGLQPKDTEFIVGPCGGSVDGPGSTFKSGLRSTAWDDAGHLNVQYAIATNCAAPFNYGGYKLAGDKLTLEYSIFWKPTTMPDGKTVVMKTMCTCGYELKYRISGLMKNNYTIDIVEVEKR